MMRVFASSFHAWQSLEEQEEISVPHGLVFPLAVVQAIGRPYGLDMVAEEEDTEGVMAYDAVFISILDSRCMVPGASFFAKWGLPIRRQNRLVGKYPLVWAGGSGLHNPMPFYDIADLIVIGDAEDCLPILLKLWDTHGNSQTFLNAASQVKSVFVPSVHNPEEQGFIIEQGVSQDISITLKENISVSHDNTRRVEIARGCKYKCNFCSLGWRTPLRENAPETVIDEIIRSPKRIHLQAGDAESVSGINEIRSALKAHGGFDQGWTGRYDSLMDNPDTTISGTKKYAFGVEGISHRLRKAVGKGYLTDENLIESTVSFFNRVEQGFVGRGAWHLITGLPTQKDAEILQLIAVLKKINAAMRGNHRRLLTLHWQPFEPLPGTPMQWCATGFGVRRIAQYIRPLETMPWMPVRQLQGRTDRMSGICAILARSDRRGCDLLEALHKNEALTIEEARSITGTDEKELPVEKRLPWDFVKQWTTRHNLEKAYEVMMRRLGES